MAAVRIEVRLRPAVLAGAVLLAALAGWTDLRARRIPNWITVPAFVVGVVVNTILNGRDGLKAALLGAVLGFGLLLPFYLLRSMGAGDLKFVVALGAFTGPSRLVDVLIGSVFVAGAMALALVIYKRRLLQTLRNIGHILISLITFRLPGAHVTLDDPNSLKIPKGVALALTVVFYAFLQLRGVV
jgi:prepilin peptidase CpaA